MPMRPIAHQTTDTMPCCVCKKQILHDRVVFKTIGGTMKAVWKGRAHGDCPSGIIKAHAPPAERLP